jgi:hypothetical protein
MGTTRYSEAIYESRVESDKASGRDFFAHDEAIRKEGRPAAVHEKLDPKKTNTVGKIIRESLDSATAPLSRAIAVGFDVTGSMRIIPGIFKDRLPKLMRALVKKGFIPDPHILFAAIGDATIDKVPLQIGQFEGGNEMDEALANVFLEGGGGPYSTESYELLMYFMARHTDIDCMRKRGQKGILFISGDELPYDHVKKTEVAKFIGDGLQEDIKTTDILAELRQKFEVFWILPSGTHGWQQPYTEDPLRGMFGQHFLRLEEPKDVCELIVSTIGVAEGYDLLDVGVALKEIGATPGAIDRTGAALVPFAKSRGVGKTAAVSGVLEEVGKDDVSRL